MNPIRITVMEIGRGEQVLNDSMADLGRMFDSLAGEGLIEPVFRIERYDQIASVAQVAYIKEAALLAMNPALGAPFRLRDFLFQVLTCYCPEQVDSWLFWVNERGKPSGYEMRGAAFDLFRNRWAQLLHRHAQTAPIVIPDVLWLPAQSYACFDGNHGISGQTLHKRGNCALLCSPAYYCQILWHEALHLCFGCDECYDDASKKPTCGLEMCVMQYEPGRSRPDEGPWLCDGQKQHIVRAHETQLRRLEAGKLV